MASQNRVEVQAASGMEMSADYKEEPSEVKVKDWKEYFMPETMTKFLNKKWIMFTFIIGFYYLIQFICCVCACNFYSDHSRYNNCARPDKSLIKGEDASEVYDMAIKLAGIFHVIEWIRTTALLFVIVCIGANLMHAWYITGILSSLFGIAVFIYLHVVYASDDSKACADAQKTRHDWLMVEIIYFWVLFWIY